MSDVWVPRENEISLVWEEIDNGTEDYEPDTYARAPVIGGCLIYTQRFFDNEGDPLASPSCCLVFVPDANHIWIK